MSDLIVYKEKLNTIALKDFNSKEMDLLYAICSQIKEHKVKTMTFYFEEIRELSNYKMTGIDRLTGDLENVYNKLIKLDFKIEKKEKLVKFVVFTSFEVDKINEIITFKVNEDFKCIINDMFGSFSKLELEEFTTLRSSYSKTAYRLLKQFRQTGYYIIQIDEFRRLFDVPKSYQISDFDKRVLNRIEDELPQYFENLTITKLRGKGRRKRFIEYIEFNFQAKDKKN